MTVIANGYQIHYFRFGLITIAIAETPETRALREAAGITLYQHALEQWREIGHY